MKAMIELGGVITNSKIYFSVPKCLSTDFGVNLVKVHEFGFDCFAHMSNEKFENVEIYTNSSKSDKAEVQIITTDFTAIIKPICNVEVEIIRSYNTFQWVAFGALSVYRKLKGVSK